MTSHPDPHKSTRSALRSGGPDALDVQLLARACEGDIAAYRQLYERFRPRLVRFIASLVRQPQIVEEVLDDTMLVVWDSGSSFKGNSKLSTWIFAIAYRKAMRALRRYDPPLEDIDADLRISDAPGPDEAWARQRLNALLRQAMARLSPQHRAVVDLTYFHDLDYREIAEVLDCPVDTVKTRMFYARRHLREHLAGELDEWI